MAPDARRAAIRMVPQDGILFDTTIGENVRFGRPGASDQTAESRVQPPSAASAQLAITAPLPKLANGRSTTTARAASRTSATTATIAGLSGKKPPALNE